MWKWLHNPCCLGDPPKKGVEMIVATQPFPSSGPKCGQDSYKPAPSRGTAPKKGVDIKVSGVFFLVVNLC